MSQNALTGSGTRGAAHRGYQATYAPSRGGGAGNAPVRRPPAGPPTVFQGRKPGSDDLRRSTGQAIEGLGTTAKRLGTFGDQQFGLAGPAYGKALGYYEKLLGSRSKQMQAMSPAITNITEGGAGARGAIRNRMARSGARDMAFAEEGRGRQASINRLLAVAPQLGAEGLERMSEAGLNRVLQSYGLAGQAAESMGRLSNEALEIEMERKKRKSNWLSNIAKWAITGVIGYATGGASAILPAIMGTSAAGGGRNTPLSSSRVDTGGPRRE